MITVSFPPAPFSLSCFCITFRMRRRLTGRLRVGARTPSLGRWQRAVDYTGPPHRMLLRLEDRPSGMVIDGCRHSKQGASCRRQCWLGRQFAGGLLSARRGVAGRVCAPIGAQLLRAENA